MTKTVSLILLTLSLLAAAPAHADTVDLTGYPCSVGVSASSLQVSLYSGPSCTGGYVGVAIVCSDDGKCSGVQWPVFQSLLATFQQALVSGAQRVRITVSRPYYFAQSFMLYAAGY